MNWSTIPSLAALRAFEAAARHQNLSAAARELNVTHAAIAQHVRALEQEFGESLLVREGRGVAPTDAGRQLAAGLAEGFGQIGEVVAELRQRGAERPVTISVTPGFAAGWLMPRIGAFWAAHPDVQISISPATTVIDLRRDGFDVAVRYGDGNWPGLSVELLTRADYTALAHPDLIAGRRVTCLDDLLDLPWLLDTQVMERRRTIEREGVDLDQVKVTMLNTNELALSAAVSGLGVTFQPRSLVERELKSGQLVALCALQEQGVGYHIVTVPGRTSAQLDTFLKWLRAQKPQSVSASE
ncbi:LysR family transcriptional regulator [uncultured Roseobacter sp.]|uniref:LysR family transcriptional regulator n=1 Tax=uncultured Roseobacter sp. TaxID=114847 RepID=UPI0026355A29|nr:LysR family transcriptional regulator [uncultured Roseobacter sp.]